VLQVDSPRGQPAPVGAQGELIQTGLTNFSMPLIRYASEDLGYLVAGGCPCGRGLALMGPVEGRKDGIIVTTDGRVMPRAGLDQVHEFAEGIQRCQLVQRQIGEVILRVLPSPTFGESDAAEVRRQLRKRLGEGTAIKLEIVDDLPLSVSGKERFIVSELPSEDLAGLRLDFEHGEEVSAEVTRSV
jgi:phenylacetate-CoA ligase